MGEKTCKNLYQKYLELDTKIHSAVQVVTPGRPLKISVTSRDIDELDRIKNELGGCLEFLSNNELFKFYGDEDLGPKVRKILKERRFEE